MACEKTQSNNNPLHIHFNLPLTVGWKDKPKDDDTKLFYVPSRDYDADYIGFKRPQVCLPSQALGMTHARGTYMHSGA